MIGWSIFGILLGLFSVEAYEDKGRKFLIATAYVLSFVIAVWLSKSFAVSAMTGGICSTTLALWIYHNIMKREAERREQERYEREYEKRNQRWEARMNELMNSD